MPTSVTTIDPVVDTDFHVTDSVSDFLPYVDEPYRRLVAGKTEQSAHTDVTPLPGFLHHGKALGRIASRTVTNVEAVREGMAELGVDHPILTPGGTSLYFGMVHHDALASALAAGYNRWILDAILDEDDDCYGAISIAPQRPADAAAEIDDHADESRIVGVALPSGGVNPPLGDERYFPIYDACERAGLPLMLHGAAAGLMHSFPLQYQGFKRLLPAHVVAHPMQHMAHVASMLTQGIPERFPDLTVVLQEGGIGWIPYFMRRFDWEYSAVREDAPLLERRPSEYLRDRFYYTSQPIEGINDPEYVSQTIRLFGGENTLLFASDYPHQDFDHSEHVLSILRGRFSDEEIGNIFGGTATAVFGI